MFRISEIDKLYKSCLAIGNFNVKQKRILVLSMEVVKLRGERFRFCLSILIRTTSEEQFCLTLPST